MTKIGVVTKYQSGEMRIFPVLENEDGELFVQLQNRKTMRYCKEVDGNILYDSIVGY